MREWGMLKPSLRLVEVIRAEEPQLSDPEVLKITEDTAAVVFELDGVDYIATVQVLPVQRPKQRAS